MPRDAPAATSAGAAILTAHHVDPFTTSTDSVRGGAQHQTLSVAHAWCEWWSWARALVVHATPQADPTAGRPAAAVSTHT
jgi:hypothetical protein